MSPLGVGIGKKDGHAISDQCAKAWSYSPLLPLSATLHGDSTSLVNTPLGTIVPGVKSPLKAMFKQTRDIRESGQLPAAGDWRVHDRQLAATPTGPQPCDFHTAAAPDAYQGESATYRFVFW